MSACAMLRSELAERARSFALNGSLPHSLTYGRDPVVCFEPFGSGLHGNFHPASYQAICARPDWRARLDKAHTTARRCLPLPENGSRAELDSCMSSDALLMNVFCHPKVTSSATLCRMLGVDLKSSPQFGLRARVPITDQRFDATEVDLRSGDLLMEAKLTETDFQSAEKRKVLRYRDFLDVFEADRLPQSERHFRCYQLIRNVLAAHDRRCSFCVLLDARRPDLLDAWYSVMSCVKPAALRTACKVLSWQELAQVLPRTLRDFLTEKYGIT